MLAFSEPLPPGIQKPMELTDSAFKLFGFLPADDDPRWPFLARFTEVRRAVGFTRLNFENAYGAVYLSDTPSYRNGYVSTLSKENCLQLDRSLDNLTALGQINDAFAMNRDDASPGMTLAITDRITSAPTKPTIPVTPCPEALYQLRLFQSGRYLARVGFNMHVESQNPILSIVNVQGIPNGRSQNHQFEKEFGVTPFDMLVRKLVTVAKTIEPTPVTRGLINPKRGNSRLYWCALAKQGIAMYHAHHKECS